MKPYYEHGGITIYHGDCRDVIPTIKGIDAAITDPPYGIDYDKYITHEDDSDGYDLFIWPILESCEKALKNNGVMAVFQATKRCHVWHKTIPRQWSLVAIPKKFGQWFPSHIQKRVDYVLYWVPNGKLEKHETANTPRDWFVSGQCANTAPGARPDHPCPRPIDTMTYLVDLLAPPQGLILDPFMGSGTTMLASKKMGRKAIGIEIEEKYCEIAAKRLSQEVLPIFDEPIEQSQDELQWSAK